MFKEIVVMNKKAEKFQKALKTIGLEKLQAQEIKDEFHTVIFRATAEIKGHMLPMAIYVDDTIYTIFRVLIAPNVVTEGTKKIILEYLNKFNFKYKIFKYYTNDNNDLILDCCITFATEEAFNPELIRGIMDVVGEHLNSEYGNITKKIWAKVPGEKKAAKSK